jgi:uncharacterized repeat protein (TIGR02543 family)
MDGPKTAEARYGTQYYLDVSSPYATAAGSGWYTAGSSANASVSETTQSTGPGVRQSFAGWAGNASGTGATSDPILMDGAKVARATWKTQYELTIDTRGNGAGIGAGWYLSGSSAVAAVNASVIGTAPGTRVEFAGWTGDATGDAASGSNPIPMNGPRTAPAEWTTEYYLQVDSDIGAIQGSGWYASQTTVTIQAPAQMTSGGQTYQFAGWTGDRTSSDASITITVNAPMTIRAMWSSAGVLGGVPGSVVALVVAVFVIALLVALVVRWRRGRRA